MQYTPTYDQRQALTTQNEATDCFPMSVQDKANAMIKHLASLAQDRLIISFAPKTIAYTVLKRIGELFPGPSKVMLPRASL